MHDPDQGQSAFRTDLAWPRASENASRAVDLTHVGVDQQVVDDSVARDLVVDFGAGEAPLEAGLPHVAPTKVALDGLLPELLGLREGPFAKAPLCQWPSYTEADND